MPVDNGSQRCAETSQAPPFITRPCGCSYGVRAARAAFTAAVTLSSGLPAVSVQSMRWRSSVRSAGLVVSSRARSSAARAW